MRPFVALALPQELSGVDAIAQDGVDRTDWKGLSAPPVDKPRGSGLSRDIFHG